jgi:hypothetical protein
MNEDNRIPTHLWLYGQLRRLEQQGTFYTILQRGEAMSGTVLVALRSSQEVCLYQQNRDIKGRLGWLPVKLDASGADGYIARAGGRDPDLWIVEIETAAQNFPLEGGVISDA